MITTLPASLIQAAKLILESSLPVSAMVGRIKQVHDSGRYDIQHEHETTPYGETHEFHATPVKPEHAVDFFARGNKGIKSWHDAEISTLKTPNAQDEFPRTHAELKPDSGYHAEIQADREPGVLYRGMSQEEHDGMHANGYIQSNGNYNLPGQEGLTYYSRDPKQAQYYAHAFAPAHVKATGQHKAYVVAIKDPGSGVFLPGTGEDEVGIPHPVGVDQVLHVHEARAFAARPGSYTVNKGWSGYEEGSSSAPETQVGWRKVTSPLNENHVPLSPFNWAVGDDIQHAQSPNRQAGNKIMWLNAKQVIPLVHPDFRVSDQDRTNHIRDRMDRAKTHLENGGWMDPPDISHDAQHAKFPVSIGNGRHRIAATLAAGHEWFPANMDHDSINSLSSVLDMKEHP